MVRVYEYTRTFRQLWRIIELISSDFDDEELIAPMRARTVAIVAIVIQL